MSEPRTVSLGRAKEVNSMEAARRPLRAVLDHSSRWSIQDLVQKTVLPKLALSHTHVAEELQAQNHSLPRHTPIHSYPCCLQTRFVLCCAGWLKTFPCLVATPAVPRDRGTGMWHSASKRRQSPAPSRNTALTLLLCTQQFTARAIWFLLINKQYPGSRS